MRLTVCLEGNTEGRVLASVDMEEIVKMTITDDIEKSNFNPKMLKSATDLTYQCGYHQGRADAIDDFAKRLKAKCRKCYVDCDPYGSGIEEDSILYEEDIDEIAEQLKER